ncbi:hypothetical protein B296_00025548 [Ensete ventricosum]|uniref:Uncharacterized protein n=1 Tax=Ensete ventricosum TaxID=4639 RepID=A0A426YJP8_ENSVE|nr:hypothetical protein B296_00025548 [Ensete ventricosum]
MPQPLTVVTGAGAVAPRDPHPVVSILRRMLASNRSINLFNPGGSNHPRRSLPQPLLAPAAALTGHSRSLLLQPPSDLAAIFRPALDSTQSTPSFPSQQDQLLSQPSLPL